MHINAKTVIQVIGVAVIAPLVMVSVGSTANTPRFEGDQLVRYVLETEHFLEYRAYRRKIIAATLTYDNEYRHPYDPPGAAPVDCTRTGRIGVTFLLKRKSKSYPETVIVYFVWTHSNIKKDEPIEKYNFRQHFEDGYNGKLISLGLTVTDEMRVDGTISVRVKVGGHEILENSFSLSQCSLAN